MRFCGKMHHGIRAADKLVDEFSIRYIADHEFTLGAVQVRAVAGIGQLIQHNHVDIWVELAGQVHEIRADEAGAAGDEHGGHDTSLGD